MQERCFQVFAEFADPAVREVWEARQHGARLIELQRLRAIGRSAKPGATFEPELGPTWYDVCTQRIDAMQAVEDALAAQLRALCERRIEQTRAELRDQQTTLSALARAPGPQATAALPLGPQLERSIVELLQEQSRRLQAMGD